MKRTVLALIAVIGGINCNVGRADVVPLGPDNTGEAYSDTSGTRSQYVDAGGGGATYTVAISHQKNGPASARTHSYKIRLGIFADGTAQEWDPDTVGNARWATELARTTLRVWVAKSAVAAENSPFSGEAAVEFNWSDPQVVKHSVVYHNPTHREYVISLPAPIVDLAPGDEFWICVMAVRTDFVLDFYAKHRPLIQGEFTDVQRTWYCGNPPGQPCGLLPLANGGQKLNSQAFVTVETAPRLVISIINDDGETCYKISWLPKMLPKTYTLQFSTELAPTVWQCVDVVDPTSCSISRRAIGPRRFYRLIDGNRLVCSGLEPLVTTNP